MKDSLDYFVKVKAQDIYFWCPYLEAYEGMLALRTPSPPKDGEGVLHFMVSPDFKEEFERIIRKHGLEPGNIPPA